MSAHLNDWMKLVPVAVVGASLLGSSHCLAMCGGLVISTARTRSAVIWYHLGRLAGYLALGAIAGKLGESVLSSSAMGVVPWIATAALASAFILMGVRVWQGRGVHLFGLPSGWMGWLYRRAGGRPGAVGLLSAFLPCGWLHGFVLGAVATGSTLAGAAFLFFFWIGTLPALSFAPWIVDRVIRPLATRVPRLCAMLLIAAGVLSLGVRASSLLAGARATGGAEDSSGMHHHSCH